MTDDKVARFVRNVTRDRPLTREEAAKYDAIRRAVDQELPEILARRRVHEELVEKLLPESQKPCKGRACRAS